MQPAKLPVLSREEPAEFSFQELKNLLWLHPSRTPSITHPGAPLSEATAHHRPLPATQNRVGLAFVLTHITRLSAGPGQRGPFISFALRSCSAVPSRAFLIHHSWQFHLSLAGHFLPVPLNWSFSSPSKELVTFTAWYWNLWTELSHSSAKFDWFHLPRSRKLDMLQLSFCFPV